MYNRHEGEKMIETQSRLEIHVPEDIQNIWQSITDILAGMVKAPVALITKLEFPYLIILNASQTKDNPFGRNDVFRFEDLYCHKVIMEKQPLIFSDARSEPDWGDPLILKMNYIAYAGFPLEYPNGNVFGTLCVMDARENFKPFPFLELLQSYRSTIESHLTIL